MTRFESIKSLYLFFYGELPSSTELELYTNLSDTIKLEVINSLMVANSNYTFNFNSEYDLVKSFFQSIFNYSDDEINLIILEQQQISLNGGVDGFQYWVDELSNSTYINVNTLAIALLNGASNEDEQRVLDMIYSEEAVSSENSNINLTYDVIATSDTYGVEALLYGTTWSNTDAITYSFNEYIPIEYYDYGSDLIAGFTPLNLYQISIVDEIIEKLENVIDLNFIKTNDNGTIRFSLVDMTDNIVGFSYFPLENSKIAGDVFLSTDFNYLNNTFDFSLDETSFSYSTIVHELGHSLGLKHPFEDDIQLPTDFDNINFSIMSYTNSFNYIPEISYNTLTSNYEINYKSVYPELLSIFDLSALQSLYGVNEYTNIEDDIYTMNFYDYTFVTLWDAGGIDTLDFSSATGQTFFDLNDGSINSVDLKTLNDLQNIFISDSFSNNILNSIYDTLATRYENNELYTGKNNYSLAVGIVIENIITGSGNDQIRDNEYDNSIFTGDGYDEIYIGNGGYDIVDGGAGIDKIYLDLLETDFEITLNPSSYYELRTEKFDLDFKNIELIVLADNVSYSPANLI